jgi:nucleotide-binding universal stress UspA family protein
MTGYSPVQDSSMGAHAWRWKADDTVPVGDWTTKEDLSYRVAHGADLPPWAAAATETNATPAETTVDAAAAPMEPRSPLSPRRILVAVDCSEQSRWATEVAFSLAAKTGCDLALLHVVPAHVTGVSAAGSLGMFAGGLRKQAAEVLHEAALGLPASVRPLKILREGDAGDEIVAAAREWNADLIVMGTHGRGRVPRLFHLLGAVANHVLRYALCPVLTVSQAPTPPQGSPAAEQWDDSLVGTAM